MNAHVTFFILSLFYRSSWISAFAESQKESRCLRVIRSIINSKYKYHVFASLRANPWQKIKKRNERVSPL